MQDYSQPSSESAGEVCWAPLQAGGCDQQQELLQMGSECTAAVNLMSMTRPQSSLHNYAAIASQHQHVADTAQASICMPISTLP